MVDAMSQNKTQATDASVDTFLAGIDDTVKREDCRRLREIMEDASGERATMWGSSIVGCGTCHYRYESGREGDTPAVGFAPRASNIALYINGDLGLLEPALARLGKHKAGKGCVWIKRLADVDITVLRELIAASLTYSSGQESGTDPASAG